MNNQLTEKLSDESQSPLLRVGDVTGSFHAAVYQSVKGLLYRQYYDVNTDKLTDPCINSDTAVNALNKAIRLGGGHTLRPHVGSYWLFEYSTGIKASLCRSEGERIINEKISRSLLIRIAEQCLYEFRGQNLQLSLF